MGFRMFSFQPAAYIGNPSRWKGDYREFTGDAVWGEIERGAGGRLHCGAFQFGDTRCNRTAYGASCGDRWVPLLDEDARATPRVPRRLLRRVRRDGLRGATACSPRGCVRALGAPAAGAALAARWAGASRAAPAGSRAARYRPRRSPSSCTRSWTPRT